MNGSPISPGHLDEVSAEQRGRPDDHAPPALTAPVRTGLRAVEVEASREPALFRVFNLPEALYEPVGPC